MEELVTFEILGVPAPQGSKTRMPNGAVVEGSSKTGRAKHKSWRAAVTETARDIADTEPGTPYDGPLQVSIEFRMPLPASRPKKAQQAALRGGWPCSVKPDLDKCVRAVLDGLETSGLIAGDSRIFAIEATQFEVIGWTGAEVTIRRWAA